MVKKVNYSEAEMVSLFKLTRLATSLTPRLASWLTVAPPTLSVGEQYVFDTTYEYAKDKMYAWNEEDLKMNFISHILPLGYLKSNDRYFTFYERTLSSEVKGVLLTAKTDFMLATGVIDKPEHPYFHFQEYKPSKRPTGDSMAQLLAAMLVAQEKNANGKPIYGCEIIGKDWRFIILDDQTYCISKAYDATNKDDLLTIIAILRHFVHILETELLDDI